MKKKIPKLSDIELTENIIGINEREKLENNLKNSLRNCFDEIKANELYNSIILLLKYHVDEINKDIINLDYDKEYYND